MRAREVVGLIQDATSYNEILLRCSTVHNDVRGTPSRANYNEW